MNSRWSADAVVAGIALGPSLPAGTHHGAAGLFAAFARPRLLHSKIQNALASTSWSRYRHAGSRTDDHDAADPDPRRRRLRRDLLAFMSRPFRRSARCPDFP